MTKLDPSPRRATVLVRALLASVVTLLIPLALPAGVASAHTSFEQSTPANGATISEAVGVITLQFSGDTEHGDDGFTVLTPDGQLHTPTAVSSADQRVFELTFDPPLAGGEIGVRWSVNAPDAHPIDGAFAFTVTAPAAGSAVGDNGQSTATATAGPSLTATPDAGSDAMVVADGSATDMSSASTSLDEFLAVETSRNGEGTARWGRFLGFAAFTLLLGGAAFAATTLRGRRTEIERAIALLRVLGAILAGGALLEYIGTSQIAEASIMSYWSSQPGLATLLRGAGGVAVAVGLVAVTAPVRTSRPTHSLSAAVNSTMEYEREAHADFWQDHRVAHRPDARIARPSISISTSPPPRQPRPEDTRNEPKPLVSEQRHAESAVIRQWVLDRSSTAAAVGVAIAIVSFWFDGHTVSKGVRPLHAIANSIHVVAGSVWIGGVVAMAVVLWSRHRSSVAPRALEMVVRFSGIATVALGAVVAAGGLMAFLVLDSVGELFSTQWGQVLLLKSAAAGLAMIGGAYNHFRLLPALEADPDDPQLVGQLRSTVTSEAIMLGFVIVVTASLVAAAS